MCWMVAKQAGKQVDFKAMDKAQKHNEDGYGVAWYEDGFVKTYKTFNYNQFKGVVAALKGHTLVAHLRYATRGEKSYHNIHPFDVPSGVMFHNGTMFGLGDKDTSDSQELANTISECDYKKIEDIAPLIKPYIDDRINRLVFFEDNGRVTIMNESLGIMDDGIWYSNDYHLKNEGWCRAGVCNTYTKPKQVVVKKDLPKHKVFVYGTLKRGYGNHRLLQGSTYLGKAKTQKRWTMIGKDMGFPYVIEQHDAIGGHIEGEVYLVSDRVLNTLDILEGVPNHYISQDIDVLYMDDFSTDRGVKMYTKTMFEAGYQNKYELITKWEARA